MKRNSVITATLFASAVIAIALPSVAWADGPFQFHALSPCRIYDSRFDGDGATPLPKGLHSLRIQGNCGIPVGAKAVTLNVTVVQPTGNGHVMLWPVGVSEPLVSTLNFLQNEPALANGAIVPLGPDSGGANDLNFRYAMPNTLGGTGHIIFDVTGYFM